MTYLAIIFIGGGSSWAVCNDRDDAVIEAVHICHKDWSSLFAMDGQPVLVQIYDATGAVGGWNADGQGVYSTRTNKRLPFVGNVATHFPMKAKRKSTKGP